MKQKRHKPDEIICVLRKSDSTNLELGPEKKYAQRTWRRITE